MQTSNPGARMPRWISQCQDDTKLRSKRCSLWYQPINQHQVTSTNSDGASWAAASAAAEATGASSVFLGGDRSKPHCCPPLLGRRIFVQWMAAWQRCLQKKWKNTKLIEESVQFHIQTQDWYIYIYMLPPPPGPTFSECSSTSPREHDDPLLTTVICIPTELYAPQDLYFKSRWPYLHWSDVTCCRKVCSHSGLFSWMQFLLWSILSEQN